jgi:hypothetical protein
VQVETEPATSLVRAIAQVQTVPAEET